MVLAECVTGYDRIMHELNDSDSIRRARGLLVLVGGNWMDSLAPRGHTLFIMPLSWTLSSEIWQHTLQETVVWQGHLLWALAMGMCVHSYHSLPSGPFWHCSMYMLRVSTKQGSASKISTEKVLICKRKHSIGHSRGTKNCLGCWHALFWFSIWTVFGLVKVRTITLALLKLQTSYSDLANGPVP